MPDETEISIGVVCSFCGKEQAQVKRIIGGRGGAFICDLCVSLCLDILDEDKQSRNASPITGARNLHPKAIYDKLEEYVIGQEKAKKVLAVAVYNHYKRIQAESSPDNQVELEKTNILLTGPTGCGKTLLAQTLARVLEVPFCIADATSITEAGYVGEDAENILLRLIRAAEYDVTRAEQGIVYIDEIDKIGRKSANPSITRDVSGEGVQQALLKIIEGCVAHVPPQGGRKHPHQELIEIKTDNILFICGGAFEGLDSIVSGRINKEHHSLGFRSTIERDMENTQRNVLDKLIPEDLLEYGFIPEFVGRLPLVVSLDPLDEDSLVRVLTQPRNAIVKQYQYLFAIDDVELTFTDDALLAVAEHATRQNMGARGLRTIIEQTLLEVMYQLPSITDARSCTVTAGMIRGEQPPLLVTNAGTIVEINPLREKTA